MTPRLEDLIPLETVCHRLPTRTHRSTVFRWAQKGRYGIKLRVVTVGSTKCTTEAWLMAFFEQVELAKRGGCAEQQTNSRRSGEKDSLAVKTRETLRKHGLLGS